MPWRSAYGLKTLAVLDQIRSRRQAPRRGDGGASRGRSPAESPQQESRRSAPSTPASCCADQHGDEHHEWRELHCPPVDQRLEDVVLELLVEDEEDDHDDSGRNRVEERHRADDDGRERRAGEWDQVEDRDDQPERQGIRNAE